MQEFCVCAPDISIAHVGRLTGASINFIHCSCSFLAQLLDYPLHGAALEVTKEIPATSNFSSFPAFRDQEVQT